MPDIIQAVSGVWRCRLKALRAPWVLLLDPSTPVLSAGRRLFLSAHPVGGLTPHWGLVQVCFDGPCVKLLFYKNSLPACHNQELLCNSPEVHHFAGRECTPERRVHGAAAPEPGVPPVRGGPGVLSKPWGGAAEQARRPRVSPVQAGAPLSPRSSRCILPTGPKAGVSLHPQGRPQTRGCWGLVGAAAGLCRASARTASGGARLLSSSLYMSRFVESADLRLHSPWIIGVLRVVNWGLYFLVIRLLLL